MATEREVEQSLKNIQIDITDLDVRLEFAERRVRAIRHTSFVENFLAGLTDLGALGFISSHLDWKHVASPANPSSGFQRIFADTDNSGHLTSRNSSGAEIDLEYVDADAIAAVEGEATLDLTGDVTIVSAGKSLEVINLKFETPTELTIDASGDVTRTQVFHSVDTENNDASDNLDGIAGGADGMLLLIRPANDGRTVVVRHNQNAAATKNILLAGGDDATLDDISDTLLMVYDASLDTNGAWVELTRSTEASAYTDADAIAAVEGEATLDLTGDVTIQDGTASKTLSILVTGDANPKMRLSDDRIEFGPGGASALDSIFKRNAAGQFTLERASADIFLRGLVTGDSDPRWSLDQQNVNFGSGSATEDVSFGRTTIGTLGVADWFAQSSGVAAGSDKTDFVRAVAGVANLALRLFTVTGSTKDANARARYAHDRIEFGAGGASALDVALSRPSSNVLQLAAGDTFNVDTIEETTGAAGVTIQSVTVKDGSIELHHGTDTISSDQIASPTGGYVIAAAQTGTTDDLDGLGGGANGRIVVVRADAGDTITVKHSNAGATSGNKIFMNDNADLALVGNDEDSLILMYDESLDSSNGAWFEVSRGDSGSSHTKYTDAEAISAIEGEGTVVLSGTLTATSYGGITEANLVDKSASESIAGTWAFPQSISDNAVLTVDGASNSGEYARFTAAGLVGRTEAEFKGDFNLEIGTDVLAYDVGLSNLAGIAMVADKFYYTSADNVHVAASVTSFARSILDDANEATFKATVNLEIGTDVLAFDTGLSNLAGVAMVADRFYYTSADNVHVAAAVTAFARSILDDANEATFKATVNLEIGTDVLAEQAIGIADDNLLEVDGSPNSAEYARFTANGLEGRTEAEFKADFNLEIGTDVLAEQTIGISDNNLVEIDSATVADDEYARFTAAGLESRSVAEVLSDIGAAAAAHNKGAHTTYANWKVIYTDGSGDQQELALGTDGQKLTATSASAAPAFEDDLESINFIIDGGGSAITTGEKGHIIVDFACTIQSVTMLADQSGSIVVDIWKDTYANFPPADGDSITSSAVPTISTATKSQDATLTGWTTAIAAGDILAYNVDSITTCERVTVTLKVLRT